MINIKTFDNTTPDNILNDFLNKNHGSKIVSYNPIRIEYNVVDNIKTEILNLIKKELISFDINQLDCFLFNNDNIRNLLINNNIIVDRKLLTDYTTENNLFVSQHWFNYYKKQKEVTYNLSKWFKILSNEIYRFKITNIADNKYYYVNFYDFAVYNFRIPINAILNKTILGDTISEINSYQDINKYEENWDDLANGEGCSSFYSDYQGLINAIIFPTKRNQINMFKTW